MNERISKTKRLEVANVCYANVAGRFAMFSNPKYRGPNFTWEWFVEHCEENSQDWMFIHNVRGHKETIYTTAKQFSKEIAERLVKRMTE
jgi:hypothetical protein